MNHISNYTNKTAVKILLTGFVFGFSISKAEPQTSDISGANSAQSAAAASIYTAAQDKRDAAAACKEAERTVKDAQKAIGDACRKATMGDSNSCMNKAIKCGETSGADTYSSTAQLMSQLSSNSNVQLLGSVLGNSGANSACPQMSGRDYFSEKDKITKDIESTKEDLAKLGEDQTKAQDDFNKTIQDLQEALNKAQDELDQKKLDMKEKNRKMVADFQNQQNQMKDDLRKKSTDILNLRGQLNQSQQDQALKLIAMTDASGKRACMKAVNDAKKAYDSVASSNSGNYIAQAKSRKTDLINTYNDCMDAFFQQRNALNKSKKQEQDQINKAITDAQQSADEMTNSLNTASSQLAEMQQDAQTEQDNATAKVTKLMQENQNKMLSAQQKMQSTLQTIAQKNQNLTEKLNRLNNSLMTLGPAPKSRSSDYAPSDASSDISPQVDIVLSTIEANPTCGAFSKSEYKNIKTKYKDYQDNMGAVQ